MYNIDHLNQLVLQEYYFWISNQEIEIMSLINEPQFLFHFSIII
jgi:hypothetical protein